MVSARFRVIKGVSWHSRSFPRDFRGVTRNVREYQGRSRDLRGAQGVQDVARGFKRNPKAF